MAKKTSKEPNWQPPKINTLYFVGYITDILEPHIMYIRGKSHVIRKIIIKEQQSNGYVMSSAVLQIPNSFELSDITKLKDEHIIVSAGFYCRAIKSNGRDLTVLSCISIIPIVQTEKNKKLNQIYLKWKNKERTSVRVDKDGYKFPYNY